MFAMQAYVSRTEYPEWADPCLRLFRLTADVSMHEAAEYQVKYLPFW